MAALTPTGFRAAHGDPTTWTPADYESYEVLAENTGKTPQAVGPDWRYALKAPAPKQRPESCHFLLTWDTTLLAWILTYDGSFLHGITGSPLGRPQMHANAAQQWADHELGHPQPWQPHGAAYRAVPTDPTA